jgi:beta-phosphoglucomutase-like phosphatase (HAD superfamily)
MPSDFFGIKTALDAVLFDFDGVLIESVDIKTAVFRQLFADHPEHLPEIVALHDAHGGISRFVKFDMIYRDILRAPLSPERRAELGRRFADMAVEQTIACPMVAGARDMLDALVQRLPMAVVSGTPETELEHILARRGLARYFVEVGGSPRTKSAIIDDMVERRSWRRARMVLIGDAMTDFDAARATGLAFIGRARRGRRHPFPPGTATVADLTELQTALARTLRAAAS